jgi:dCTP deaminase
MILTGKKIIEKLNEGLIEIYPFERENINPNSYNFRLGRTLKESYVDNEARINFRVIEIPDDGFVLKKKTLYLGHTHETLGSNTYAMSLIGRSSIGRLGLFLQVSANLGHTFSCHQWTLELFPIHPIKIYPLMNIGQISFWENQGELRQFNHRYNQFNIPHESIELTPFYKYGA